MTTPPDATSTPAPKSSINLSAVQGARKTVLFALGAAAVAILLFGHSVWPDEEDGIHELIEQIGLVLLIVAIVGRTWCSLYISGRKKLTIVDVGPYSISRNPLYVFSFIGATGAGAQFGSVTAAFAACLVTIVVFYVVVRKEERFLAETFGQTYLDYVARVPRFLPKFSLWRNVATLEIRPPLVARTFLDACVFLAALPIAEGIEYLQSTGVLPVWWVVP
ncbi:methyltransferase family protein [Ancylobacter terrae]|uniref:methyltransferase family protein n=1 Tax=Ancylobacter sp. sgz301288 TaxID=3342077 RepID=UPI00385D34A2